MTYGTKFEEFTSCALNHLSFSTQCDVPTNIQAFYQVASNLRPTKNFCPMLWVVDSSGLKTYHHIKEINRFSNYHQWFEYITTKQNNTINSDQQEIEYEPTNRVNEDRYRTTNRVIPQDLGIVFFSINHGSLTKVRPWTPNSGQFWIYTHNTILNLAPLQIFRKVEAKNYKDSCFIHTIKESGLFTLAQIDSLRFFIKTRNFPKSKIRHICEFLNCNIEVITIEDNGKKYIWRSNLLKQFRDTNYDKNISMYLWKNHYFINRKFTINEKQYDPVKIIKALFLRNLFQPIDPMCNEILKSLEYTNKMIDYETLEYDKNSCKIFEHKISPKEYEIIIYSDFETDTSVEYHIPYLICSCFQINGKTQFVKFEGEDCADKYLEWLPTKSLIFFHNLKYDGSFFLNTKINKNKCQIMERNGHIMQIYMRIKNKVFTFRDSYVMISQPLRNFQTMFHLPVHKEVSPYKIYNRENRNKRLVPIIEVLECLRLENPFDHIAKQKLFIENCLELKLLTMDQYKLCMQYIDTKPIQPIDTKPIHTHTCIDTIPIHTINVDIMAYSIHYCAMDCKVLMLGINQFNKDLQSIFTDNECQYNHITDFISISSLAYNLTAQYGCFDECYELTG
ncbi:MAG: DNA polymerase, partial [Methanobrevibacter sp.]|nr:DNA polymerase [Candidatus Methanovirga australis]